MALRDLAMDTRAPPHRGAQVRRTDARLGMKRRPVSSINVAPSPRNASVASGAGSRPMVNGGGMELHEFGIGDHGTRARRHAEAFAARFRRVGRDGIKRAETARREYDRRRAEQNELRVGAGAVAREETGDAAVFQRRVRWRESLPSRRWTAWRVLPSSRACV